MRECAVGTHDLIVTIIRKGHMDRIIKASREAGAEGGTVIPGRGIGIHETKKFMGIPIEPEKEILLTLVEKEKSSRVLSAIVRAGDLNKPGTGIGFVIELREVTGIVHFLKKLDEEDG